MFYKKKFSNAMKVLVTETFKEKFSYSKIKCCRMSPKYSSYYGELIMFS